MATYYINAPVQNNIIQALSIGDEVFINGTVYTARDVAHKNMVRCIEDGQQLPFDLNGQIIYYTGPCPAPPDKVIGSAGPTTSGRMDSFTPILLENGLKIMIGKGERNTNVVEAIQKYNAVYLATIGGAGAYLSKRIVDMELIAYPELGPEAIYKLEVNNFPCIVAIDSKGQSIYKKLA